LKYLVNLSETVCKFFWKQINTILFKYSIRIEFQELESYSFVEFEFVNRSLFYKINGKNPNLKPYLLAAHFDVVGVENNWDHDPFEANIVDSFIYARGTLDDKSSVIAQLEAIRF
jgi:acetylornithine deacetylase/succinyl-diaminopimelate desuccinylase-like protein